MATFHQSYMAIQTIGTASSHTDSYNSVANYLLRCRKDAVQLKVYILFMKVVRISSLEEQGTLSE